MFQDLWDSLAKNCVEFIANVAELDSRLVLLVILTVLSVIVIDGLVSRVKQTTLDTGIRLNPKTKAFGIEGVANKPVKDYISEKQGIAGRPDALLIEDGFVIPVEHKPFARKLRDRYVAQLLIYMRLIEEHEGKRPPYGYLILGKKSRKVKVANTYKKQQWLSKILDEMNSHLNDGKQTTADPHPAKCKNCSVRDQCDFSINENAIQQKKAL